jgi:hypothetical protein
MNKSTQQLHDRATRGDALSASEQVQLDAWYASQDQLESALLSQNQPAPGLDRLQNQLNTALAQLTTISHHLQELTTQNDTLRREIAALQLQLAQSATSQPA